MIVQLKGICKSPFTPVVITLPPPSMINSMPAVTLVVAPVGPVGPVGPVTDTPVGPVGPVGPVTDTPVGPVGPVGPVTDTPVGPVGPVGPATVEEAPVGPVGPVGPAGPGAPLRLVVHDAKVPVPTVEPKGTLTTRAPVPELYEVTVPIM